MGSTLSFSKVFQLNLFSVDVEQNISAIAVYQCLKLQEEISMNHAFTLALWGITSQQDILGTETAELGKTDIAISFSWIQLTE